MYKFIIKVKYVFFMNTVLIVREFIMNKIEELPPQSRPAKMAERRRKNLFTPTLNTHRAWRNFFAESKPSLSAAG